jgi:flagellin
MTVINTNISALRAANASNSASQMLGTAMQRLSTGTRINSAKDDAAGLAIATSMTSQITGMNQGIRNANDGISLAQTAEGALGEVTNMLQRIRELATQSASGTYQDTTDRAYMQTEVDQLTSQIDQVVTNTKFNGVALFDGSTATVKIQAGANASDTVDLRWPT